MGNTTKSQSLIQLLIIAVGLIVLNVLASFFFERFDLTKEKRFTLTEATEDVLIDLEDLVYVKVYLEGEFPAGFKRLGNATREMLNEFRSYAGSNIEYEFINPMASDKKEERDAVAEQLVAKGLDPVRLIENTEGYSEKPIFPGAIINYRGRELPVVLLQDQPNVGPQQDLNNSIALLEYNLANAIAKIQREARPRLAFLSGHGELDNQNMSDIASYLSKFYTVDRLNLKDELYLAYPKYSAVIVAKPTEKFEESNKFKLDQYITNGGRVLWLLESLRADLDSLRNIDGKFIALDYGLNLEDQLFKYGVRVNFNLVRDLQCTQIPLTVGREGQQRLFNWSYSPVITNHNQEHPVTKNLDAVMLQFAGSIDTIKTRKEKIKKTVLMSTTQYSASMASPVEVNVNELRNPPDKESFQAGEIPVAVALEGEFPSLFKNRLDPSTKRMVDTLEDVSFKEISPRTKMIVVSDGDIIRNDYNKDRGMPSPLGYYKYTGETFANKDFLLNSIEWLTDDSGVIAARSKDVKLRLLDKEKVSESKSFWQLLNIFAPIITVLLFAFFFTWLRKRKYAS